MYIYKAAAACSLGVVGDWADAWRRRRRSRMYIYEISAYSLGVASHVSNFILSEPAELANGVQRKLQIKCVHEGVQGGSEFGAVSGWGRGGGAHRRNLVRHLPSEIN
jgi:hypothetical protein